VRKFGLAGLLLVLAFGAVYSLVSEKRGAADEAPSALKPYKSIVSKLMRRKRSIIPLLKAESTHKGRWLCPATTKRGFMVLSTIR
jgi:hypothetical protein